MSSVSKLCSLTVAAPDVAWSERESLKYFRKNRLRNGEMEKIENFFLNDVKRLIFINLIIFDIRNDNLCCKKILNIQMVYILNLKTS